LIFCDFRRIPFINNLFNNFNYRIRACNYPGFKNPEIFDPKFGVKNIAKNQGSSEKTRGFVLQPRGFREFYKILLKPRVLCPNIIFGKIKYQLKDYF